MHTLDGSATDPERVNEAISLVTRFEEAVNRRAVAEAAGMAAEDVAIAGPRGTAHGVDVLRRWVTDSGIRLTSRRLFVRLPHLVAEQTARWHDPGTGALGDAATVATLFTVRDSKIAGIARYDSGLAAALLAAGLAEIDEVTVPGPLRAV